MPGDDNAYGCDNDLNNYGNHGNNGSVTDRGAVTDSDNDSGGDGFNWMDLAGSSDTGSGHGGNPYNNTNPSSVQQQRQQRQEQLRQRQEKMRQEQQARQEKLRQQRSQHQPTRGINFNDVLNRSVQNKQVIDYDNSDYNINGHNPIKKNVLDRNVLDQDRNDYSERPLIILPIVFTEATQIDNFEYRFKASIWNQNQSPLFNPNAIIRNSGAYTNYISMFNANGPYGRANINLYGASADLAQFAANAGYDMSRYNVDVKGSTATLVHIAGQPYNQYTDLSTITDIDGNKIDSVRIQVTLNQYIRDYEFFTFISEELVHSQEQANLSLKFMSDRDFASYKSNYLQLVNEENSPYSNAHQSIGKNQGLFKQLMSSFLETISRLPTTPRQQIYGDPLLVTHPQSDFNKAHEVIGSFYNKVVLDVNSHMEQIMRETNQILMDAFRVFIKNMNLPIDITNETH